MIMASHKFVRTAPRKIRIILDQIRRLKVEVAENKLQFMPGQASKDVFAAVHAAKSNAKDQGMTEDSLVIVHAVCDEGPRLKRRIVGSRGRAHQIVKQLSHINIGVDAPKQSASSTAVKKEINHGT